MSSDSLPFSDRADALETLHSVRERQYARTRWFGVCMIVVGVVLVPSGFSLPWELPARLAVIAMTFVALIAMSSYVTRRRVVPSSTIPSVATACWVGLSLIIEVIWGDDDLAWGLIAAVVAATPFFIAGAYYLMRRPRADRADATRAA